MTSKIVTCFIAIIFTELVKFARASAGWSYADVSSWSQSYPSCSGSYQSPIDIATSQRQSTPYGRAVVFTNANGADLSTTEYTITNNGHSVSVAFPSGMWEAELVFGSDTYGVMQMHFHWGSDRYRGSEHTINGRSYAMETHIVAFNKGLYANENDAASGPFGLAVFALLHELDDSVSVDQTLFAKMSNFTDALPEVITVDQTAAIGAFDLTSFLELVNRYSYYRYLGSLTTPPCTQNVVWTVFAKTVPIRSEELTALRNLDSSVSGVKLVNNFRPTQPLNSYKSLITRSVYGSFYSKASTERFSLIISALALLTYLLTQ